MKINIFLLVFIALLLILMVQLCKNGTEYFTNNENKDKKNEVEIVKRPFVNLYDNLGNRLNVILISKPFSGDSQYEKCLEYKNDKKYIILGIASYLEFPNLVSNPFENFEENYKKYKYKELCEGWIHCFRKPENYFPRNMPLLFASESDWTDCNALKPDKSIKKEYDFIYICLKVDEKKKKCDDWATFNKNWDLAKKCLHIFCNKYKLKGLLVGRKDCELPQGCNDLMETTNMVPYQELKKMYNKCKFIFLPNEKDASPRVLTEALATDLPALINKNILGGWKYINSKTGEFFTDENDVGPALEIMLNKLKDNKYKARDYFIKNYSVANSGRKLKKFLYDNYGSRINIDPKNVDYISPEFARKDFKTCYAVLDDNKSN